MKSPLKITIPLITLLLISTCDKKITQLALDEATYSILSLEMTFTRGFASIPETETVKVNLILNVDDGNYNQPENIFDNIKYNFTNPEILTISKTGIIIPMSIGETNIQALYIDVRKDKEIKSNEMIFEVKEGDTGLEVISTSPVNLNTDVDRDSYPKTIVITFNNKIYANNPAGLVSIRDNPADDRTLTVESVSADENLLVINLNSVTLSEGLSYDILIDKSFVNSQGTGLTEDYWYRFATEKYFDNLDGTVYDPGQGVTWMKCSQGPSGSDSLVWNSTNNSCSGTGVNPSKTFIFCAVADNSCDDGFFLNGDGNSLLHDTCEFLNLLNSGVGFTGKTNWSVPILSKLQSLVRNESPTINRNIFPITNVELVYSYYWSSNTDAGNSENAWYVLFDLGLVGSFGKENGFYVRCVSLD